MLRRHFSSPLSLLFSRALLACVLISGLNGCASNVGRDAEASEQRGSEAAEQADPFEEINRRIFVFNYHADQWVLRPAALGYQTFTPPFLRLGVSNFFSNLKEINNTANSMLQWKWGKAGTSGGRFLLNSTVGLFGLFDVAAQAGLYKDDGEDFGQTLAVWGIGQGPYLMLPILGPSSVRDGVGSIGDQHANPVSYMNPIEAEYGLRVLNAIDGRAQLLQSDSLVTGDSYTLLRDFYMQRRNYLINDGDVQDDFGDDFGADSDYYYDEEEGSSDEYGY